MSLKKFIEKAKPDIKETDVVWVDDGFGGLVPKRIDEERRKK